ncbi:hypothetical protein [Elioraea thermophila]|uniref:hypothetical protein n=1 Tax=Elioraea thermophila TaxID=2185104 RepID=UPI000DF30E2E|nr:hypothetical protein [Elioraea thermophila]
MSERHFLILAEGPNAQRRVTELVRGSGGRVVIALASGAVIARFAEAMKEAVAALPGVRHLGGVELAPRPIRRIRLDLDGRPVGG